MADLKNLLRQEAAQCRRLAELVTEQTIRQALMEMAARLDATSLLRSAPLPRCGGSALGWTA
jgi:hypothetical protein